MSTKSWFAFIPRDKARGSSRSPSDKLSLCNSFLSNYLDRCDRFCPACRTSAGEFSPAFLFKAHLSVDNEHNIISTTFIPFPVDNKPFKEQRNQDEKQKQYEKKDNKSQKDTVHSSQSCLENSHDIKSDV